ncbi:MAG TPA: hypothetical protein VHU15_16055 [Stellaceae bacterium]|nr:hypothetical protein [Stellaceae bacterium]
MVAKSCIAKLAAILALSLDLLLPCAAAAGPPFRTDDPVPVEPQHWEIFTFSAATHVRGDTAGTLPGIDANYGAAADLQLHAAMPLAFDLPTGAPAAFGPGDGEVGAKIRFLHEDSNGWRPQAAIYPTMIFPTGNAARNLGTGHPQALLPIWLQKTFGRTVTFAGAGYRINPGVGRRNFWYSGWTVQRQLADNFTLGAEIFHQTADTIGGKDQTGFDVGAVYDLDDHYHLMMSVGEGLQNRATTNEFSYYAALQMTF